MLRYWVFILGFAVLDTQGQSILEGPNPKMKLIGVYDNHSYFYDSELRTWPDSRSYCVSLGMKIAEIYNINTMRMLQSYHAADYDFKTTLPYWLAGRDARSPSQFVWDGSEDKIPTNVAFGAFLGPWTHVAYINEQLESYLYSYQHGVICQS